MGMILGLQRDYIGLLRVLKGFEWDNGKGNGNYHNGLYGWLSK